MNEEEILKRAVRKGLTTEKQLSPWNYRVTMSGSSIYSDKTDYIDMIISIDQHPIVVFTHKDIRRATLHYCYFDGEETFDNGEKKTYQLYLNADDMLDGNPFYTSSKEERRRLKLEKLIQKIKNE
jgi:hypothetical protein